MLVLEAGCTLAAIVLAMLVPRLGARWFSRIEAALTRVSRNRRVCLFTVAALPVALRLAMLPALPPPEPSVTDEFCYSLTADTFAGGRIANATHPLWEHFEAFGIFHRPTYGSKYPPAQAAFLAIGQRFAGVPWAGVVLSISLMCAAIYWMLLAWLPPRWAFFGGVLTALRFGVAGYWMNSFFGGAVAALGGALIFGALPRLWRRRRFLDAILLGAGFVLLMNSRPYEGLVAGVSVTVALLVRMPAQWKIAPWNAVVALAPAMVVVALGLGFMLWFNSRVTSDPWKMPYQLYEETYATAPVFIWQSPRTGIEYRNRNIAVIQERTAKFVATFQTPAGFVRKVAGKGYGLWLFFVGIALTPALFVLRGASSDKRLRFLVLVIAMTFIGTSVTPWSWPHYSAPITAPIVACLVQCYRRLRACRWRGQPAGRFLVRATPLVCVVLLGARMVAGPLGLAIPNGFRMSCWTVTTPLLARDRILRTLERQAGNHLVIVHYRDDHSADVEWVYNAADIDRSKVVWAQDMGVAKNGELAEYFKGWKIWTVDADAEEPALMNVEPAGGPAADQGVRPTTGV
jgi:hypothetical protein